MFIFSRTVDAQTARISYGGTSGYNVPVWVTYDAGLFKKYGLNAEVIFISGDAPEHAGDAG
jgi:ABC-type nitrate/sulfonate/bicarbonate transport system substrate-binding protein